MQNVGELTLDTGVAESHDIELSIAMVDTYRCVFLQIEERFSQTVFIHMMQQGGEPERAVLAGRFTHTVQTT